MVTWCDIVFVRCNSPERALEIMEWATGGVTFLLAARPSDRSSETRRYSKRQLLNCVRLSHLCAHTRCAQRDIQFYQNLRKMGKQRSVKRQAGGRKGTSAPAPTAKQLYEQALLALQYDDFDSATKCLKRAAKQEPENLEIIETLGALLAENGPPSEAIQVILCSCCMIHSDPPTSVA